MTSTVYAPAAGMERPVTVVTAHAAFAQSSSWPAVGAEWYYGWSREAAAARAAHIVEWIESRRDARLFRAFATAAVARPVTVVYKHITSIRLRR